MPAHETKPIPGGILKIKAKDLKVYEKTSKSWKKSLVEFPEAMNVIKLFMAHNNLDVLKDKKNPAFLKGELSPRGNIKGARINILPDGKRLDKAYSLFAKHLAIHDQTSHSHWDVLYQNPGGTYSYAYTLEKKKKQAKKKYRTVEEFGKHYPKLKRNVASALKDKDDHLAIPMYTLLKTYMRIGNEIYYNAHGHKGLTTLKKKDISIKGSHVTFNYLAKDGVPINTTERFPDIFINRLMDKLEPLNKSSFVFVNTSTGHPLRDVHFKEAFRRYCGKEFYPHIVRSYYATNKAKEFLSSRRSATKEEIRALFMSIAEKLGHKRFVKKENVWKESYNVTIHHYIKPEIVEKIMSIVK